LRKDCFEMRYQNRYNSQHMKVFKITSDFYQFNPNRYNSQQMKVFCILYRFHSKLKVFKFVSGINIFSGLLINYSNKNNIHYTTMYENIPKIIAMSLVKGLIYEVCFFLVLFCMFSSFLFREKYFIDLHIIPGLKYGTIDYGSYVTNYKHFVKI